MAKPKSSAEMLKLIGNELTLLWVQMDAYQTLFLIEREKRKKLMDETAPGFFAIVQFTLIESLLLRICRLLDPAEQGGNANISWQTFWQLLAKEETDDESDSRRRKLRLLVKVVIEDWSPCRCNTQAGTEEKYARLKKLRNKVLAHNDFTARQKILANEIWIDISEQDYGLIQELAGRLWSIYRQAYRALNNSDVLEPQHSCLKNRPAMLLKALCRSIHLESLLDVSLESGHEQPFADLTKIESEWMGEDKIHQVFETDQFSDKYGTTGESQ